MKTTNMLMLLGLIPLVASVNANAALLFDFQQVGGDVVMTTSGQLDTSLLVPDQTYYGWGSIGLEDNGHTDIMGNTTNGSIDSSYAFHDGTDYSAWASATGPWTHDSFSSFWAADTGSEPFTTYVRDSNFNQVPGFGLNSNDLVNGIWSSDQIWTASGSSFASLGMLAGIYTVKDAVTGESITYQIGDVSNVPLPPAVLLFAPALLGFLGLRRKSKLTAAA